MRKTHVWVSLILALVLAANALAPATTHAFGPPGKPIDEDTPPTPKVDEAGDPMPDGNGLTIRLGDVSVWREALLLSLRMQFACLRSEHNSRTTREYAAIKSLRRTDR